VLADTLRTDRARLRPLHPDSAATTALRATVRARVCEPMPMSSTWSGAVAEETVTAASGDNPGTSRKMPWRLSLKVIDDLADPGAAVIRDLGTGPQAGNPLVVAGGCDHRHDPHTNRGDS